MAFKISYLYQINDKYTGKLNKIRRATEQYTGKLRNAQKAVKGFSSKLMGMQSTLGTIAGAIGGAAVLGVFTEFEESMNRLNAVTLATTDQMVQMREMAKELGAATQFSASQAAKGMVFLGTAGLSTEQILKAIPGTLQLAAAGGLDLASAADIATNVLAQMGLGVEELTRVNDVLSLVQAKANTDVLQAAEALKNVGTFASSAGVSLEKTTALIGAMANAGVKGGEAGTLLRNAFKELLTPTKAALKIFRRLRINLKEFITPEGKIKNFSVLIQKLNDSGIKAGEAMEAFGDRGGRAILALQKAGKPAIDSLTLALSDAGGTAEKMAKIQMRGLPGLIKTIKSVTEALVIALMESGLDKFLESLGNKLVGLIRKLKAADPVILKIVAALGFFVVVGGPVLIFLGLVASGVSSMIGLFAALGPIMAGVGAVFTAIMTPIGLIVAGIVALGAAIYFLIKHWDSVKQGIKYAISDPLGAALSVINSVKAAFTDLTTMASGAASKVGAFFGLGESQAGGVSGGSVSADNARATAGTINGSILVSAHGPASVKRAGMETSMPGNLGFNLQPQGAF